MNWGSLMDVALEMTLLYLGIWALVLVSGLALSLRRDARAGRHWLAERSAVPGQTPGRAQR